jgi:ATP-binding cassette subfamily B protein
MSTAKEAKITNELVISPFQFYWKSFWQFPFLVSIMLIMEISQAAMMVMLPFAIHNIVSAAELHSPENGLLWDAIKDPFYMLIWLTVAITICSRCSGVSLVLTASRLRRMPRIWLFEHLLNHSMGYFSNRHSGALGAKVHDVTSGVAMATWTFLFEILSLFILFVASAVMMSMVYWPLGVIVMLWGVTYGCFLMLTIRKRAYWMERISKSRAKLTGLVIDVVSNIFSLKSYARRDYELKKLLAETDDEVYCNIRFGIWGEIGSWIHFILTFSLIVGSIFFCIKTYEAGMITLAAISYVFTILFVLSSNARNLIWSLQSFMEYIGQIRDGINTIMVPNEINDNENASELKVSEGVIEYKGVDFSYDGVRDKVVVHGLDLTVPSRQKLGIMGPSGAGKSTMVSLLLRFYELNTGSISIDGKDISKVSQDSLRSNIAVIPQDTALFHRRLIDNIRYGNFDATDEDVMEAAKKAHAHEFIKDLPEGYDTMVGERGLKLSGGQRQRIAIARAILKDAPILVLDEATSALDSESEKYIQESLEELMEGKTVIAIAHRLSTISHLDRLIVMDEGKITEDGTHNELLGNDGHYARLWAMQSGGFLAAA